MMNTILVGESGHYLDTVNYGISRIISAFNFYLIFPILIEKKNPIEI